MRRFLTTPLLLWGTVVLVATAALIYALTHPTPAPAPHPYPVSNNANVARALNISTFTAAIPTLTTTKVRTAWCATTQPLVDSYITDATTTNTPTAATAFGHVASTLATYCTTGKGATAVHTAVANLSAAVTGNIPPTVPEPVTTKPKRPTPTTPTVPTKPAPVPTQPTIK